MLYRRGMRHAKRMPCDGLGWKLRASMNILPVRNNLHAVYRARKKVYNIYGLLWEGMARLRSRKLIEVQIWIGYFP